MPLYKKLLSVLVEEKYAKLFPSSTSVTSLNTQQFIALAKYIRHLDEEDVLSDFKKIELDMPNCLGFFIYGKGYFMCLTKNYEYIDQQITLSEEDSHISHYAEVKLFKPEVEKQLAKLGKSKKEIVELVTYSPEITEEERILNSMNEDDLTIPHNQLALGSQYQHSQV